MPQIRVNFLLTVLCTLGLSPVYAQTADHETDERGAATEHEADSGHEGGHESHKNSLVLFTGITHGGRRKNGLALGVGYDRHLTDSLSIGVFAEHTFGDGDFTVYVIPLAYRVNRWKFIIAPGIEDGHHGKEELFRIAGEYAFEVGTWEVSPTVVVDFVDGDEVLIFGVVFGKGF